MPRSLRYLLLGLLVGLAIAINVVRFFLLYADDYRAELQHKVRELTELPIEIGRVRARMQGFNPELILEDIQVLAADSTAPAAIKLEQMRLRVSLVQLLFTRQLLPSSRLTLIGAELSIVRKKDGSLSIAGLTTNNADEPYWLLDGGRYELLNSHIIWRDEQRNASPIAFSNVDLLLKNEPGGQHEVHFLAALPEKYGKSLRASMSFQGDVFKPDNMKATVYIAGQDIVLTELMTGEMPLGLKIRSGVGSFKKLSRFENSRLTAMLGSISAKNLVLDKPGQPPKSLHINALKTGFKVRNKVGGWELSVVDLLLETDHKQWPSASFSLGTDNAFSQIAASIQQLDLQELSGLLRFFTPLDVSQHGLLKNLHIKGMLKDFSLYVDNEHSQYAFNGIFNNIFTHAFDGFPEIENLSGRIKGSHEQGQIVFNTDRGTVFFPELFRKAWTIQRLTGALEWLQTPEKWQIQSKGLVLNTRYVDTETQVFVSIPKNAEPVFMDLQASFANMQDISHISTYYPVSIMDEDVVEWLDNAFVSGKITRGDVLVYGELDKFPFVDNQGVLEVLYDMQDVELQYNSDWPNLNHVNAEVLFLKNSVSIDMFHAQVQGLTVKHALLEIPSFATSDHLLVHGKVEGEIIDGLHFLQNTPLQATVNRVLEAITPTGLTQVDLDLNIPLAATSEVVANVITHLTDAAIKVNAIDLDISEVTGDLRFTEVGLFCQNLQAKTLGYPLQMQAKSDALQTLINIVGQTDIPHLEQQFAFFDSWILKDQRLKGATTYQLELALPANEQQSATLSIDSDLVGVAVDFPEPLKKSATDKSSLRVAMALNDEELLPLVLHYQEQLTVAMHIHKQQNELHSAHIFYGKQPTAVQAIAPAAVDKGIRIDIERDVFDVAKWMTFIGQKDEVTNPASALTLNEINLHTRQLHWNHKDYGAFDLAMQRLSGQWQGELACSMAKGTFSLPLEQTEQDVIKLEMRYLNLTELMQVDFQQDTIEMAQMPLIKVVSEQLWWKDSNLGRLQIATERRVNGIRFKNIDVISEQHSIELKADWVGSAGSSFTEMSGRVSTEDFGGFLAQFDFDNDFKDSQGDIDFFAKWPGSPYHFAIEAMEAEMDVELQDGRLASVEPGFGRILGLLAMEQWIKRLTLDFGDIYKQGMSFNRITGHFNIRQGKALSNNLLIDAVPAQIFISGTTDLIAKTFDHRMGVMPKSSGAIPIAGTIVGSIAGVIAQVFTDDYKEGYFFGSHYKVKGPWHDFKVIPIHEQDGLLKKTWTGLTDFSWMSSLAK